MSVRVVTGGGCVVIQTIVRILAVFGVGLRYSALHSHDR